MWFYVDVRRCICLFLLLLLRPEPAAGKAANRPQDVALIFSEAGGKESALTQSVLVVDDESSVLNLIEGCLSSEGYRVVTALSLNVAYQRLAEEEFKIVIVDIGLPDGDGLDLVHKVRASSSSGIIVVSGRGQVADRVVGLEVGADDYIVKPFHVRDLLARVRAVGRRLSELTAAAGHQQRPTRRFCGFEINAETRQLRLVEGKEISLTTREFDVLWTLVENAPAVLTREAIVHAAFGPGHAVGGRPVDGLIARLREKLFPDGSGHLKIRTVQSRGYQLTC